MRKRVIEPGSTVEVQFSAREIEDIRERTFADPGFGNAAVQVGADYSLQMTLDDIEILQGYVAAEANHAKDRRLQKRLDRIFDKLQKYLDAYDEAQTEASNSSPMGGVLAFPSSSRPQNAAQATIARSILHQLLDDAGHLGSDLLEVRYKDGHEEVFVTVRGFSYRLAILRSSHPDAAQLRDELAMLATRRKRSAARSATELTASYKVRVETYDDFGETAFRVMFKRK